jgi:hypothetical protein
MFDKYYYFDYDYPNANVDFKILPAIQLLYEILQDDSGTRRHVDNILRLDGTDPWETTVK